MGHILRKIFHNCQNRELQMKTAQSLGSPGTRPQGIPIATHFPVLSY